MRPEWGEEQLRYRILCAVYERVDGRCEQPVTGTAIGAALNLHYEDLFRVVRDLERKGYLLDLGAGAHLCITSKGMRYIEEGAGRRRSIRHGEGRLALL